MYDDNEDTDPGSTLSAIGPFRAITQTTRFLGNHRRLFVPLGVLSLIAIGVHTTADRFDDWLFRLFDWMDATAEWGYAKFADSVLTTPEEKKIDFAEFVTLADKETAAQWGALVVELVLDFHLGIASIGAFPQEDMGYVVPGSGLHHRVWSVVGRRIYRLKRMFSGLRGYLRHVSVEKIYVPLAVAVAAATGTLALFVAIDGAFFALGRQLPASWGAWHWLSPWPAVVSSFVVMWRLGLPALVGSMARAERTMKRDIEAGQGVVARTTRGMFGAAVVLPVLAAGIWAGTPLGVWMEQIFTSSGP